MILYYFFLLTLSLLSYCSEKKEDDISQMNRMIEDEKYDTVNLRIKDKLSTKKNDEELISSKSTREKHLLELSNDRNRIVYTQDKTIYFRDLANPLTKQLSFSQYPINLSISSDAEHALVSIPLPNGVGCKLLAVSLLESREAYASKSILSCSHHGGITSDGTSFYYFIDDSLYFESTLDNKGSKLIRDKKFFQPVASGIKNNQVIHTIGKTFLIFNGNGGIYRLYWLDPKKQEEEIILEDAATPKIYYGNGKNAYIVTGTIGDLYCQELKLSAYGKPILGNKIPINYERVNPWPTTNQDEFISGYEGEVFRWKEDKKIKIYPLFTTSFWIVARDHIIYVDKKNDLILSNMEYSDGDYKLLELFNQTKK